MESLALELGVNDLRAVMDAAGSERAVLIGFEEGGTLASMFAAGFPDRAVDPDPVLTMGQGRVEPGLPVGVLG